MTPILDVFVASGHGGEDPGAVAGDLFERDLNARVAERLAARLRDHGIAVDCDLDHGNPRFPEEAELAWSLGGARYYLAVHHNAAVDPDVRGAEAYGAPGAGAALATALHHAQVDALRTIDPQLPDRGVRDPSRSGAAKHLDAAPGVVVVLEPCFISSADDRAVCTRPEYPELLAEAWCRALIDHGRGDGAWSATFVPAGPTLPPVFSVVMPTCDRPEYLPAALGSVLAQTVTGLEVLVIDDGRTAAVVDTEDPRVRVLRPGGGRGPAATRNSGLDAARGRYVTFLDDDDLWTPERLDLALRGLRRAPVAVCLTQHLGGPPPEPRRLEGHVGDTVLDSTTPNLGATAVDRFLAPRFLERWKGVEDVVWWWELAQEAPVASEAEVGYLVRMHDGDRGQNPTDVRVRENRQFLREQRAWFRAHPEAAAHRWRRVALLAREDRRYLAAAHATLMHIAIGRRVPRSLLGPLVGPARRLRRKLRR